MNYIYYLCITLFILLFEQPLYCQKTVVIPLDSKEGQMYLASSPMNNNFLKLIENYTIQKNQVYCGIASSVIILNALEIQPESLLFNKYKFLTQENVFPSVFENKKLMYEIYNHGITLDKLGYILAQKEVGVTIKHASDDGYLEFTKALETSLNTPDNFILVNFFRPSINQNGGGHFSPIAAYNKEKQAVLILDVAKYKQKPFWIDTKLLWQSMNTFDTWAQKNRGYIIIRGKSDDK